jgi:hypothetical protein
MNRDACISRCGTELISPCQRCPDDRACLDAGAVGSSEPIAGALMGEFKEKQRTFLPHA